MEFTLDDDVRDDEVAQLLDSAVINKKDKSERQWKETSTASILHTSGLVGRHHSESVSSIRLHPPRLSPCLLLVSSSKTCCCRSPCGLAYIVGRHADLHTLWAHKLLICGCSSAAAFYEAVVL